MFRVKGENIMSFNVKKVLIESLHDKCQDYYLNGVCHLGEYDYYYKPCEQS